MANSGVSLCQLGLSRSTSEPYWKMSSLFPSRGLAQVSKLHSSIRGGTHRVPGTPSHPSVLSILVLSLQHRLCSLRVPIKPVRGAVAGPHPPPVELWSVSVLGREYQGSTASLRGTLHSNLISLWREACFYRQVSQILAFQKSLRYGERFGETQRVLLLLFSVLD